MLAPWAEGGGIRRETVWKGIREYGIGCVPMPGEDPLVCVRPTGSRRAGVGVGFYGGKAYLLEDNLDFRGEAGQIVMGHLQKMLELEQRDIPNVEFLLFGTDASQDLSRKRDDEGQPRSAAEMPPVMHYCTYPDLFAELLVPGDFWFHFQDFDKRMAAQTDPISGSPLKPWHEREEVLACNCGGYHRFDVDPEHPWRALGGEKGAETPCSPEGDDAEPQFLQCPSPRLYYENFLSQKWRPDLLKSEYLSRVLEEWDKVKYILFMDGITCSTRLQQYLNLGFSTSASLRRAGTSSTSSPSWSPGSTTSRCGTRPRTKGRRTSWRRWSWPRPTTQRPRRWARMPTLSRTARSSPSGGCATGRPS